MLFSIIMSIDCARDDSIREYMPRTRQLKQTENDSNAEYQDLWPKGKHRKLTGVISERLFAKITQDLRYTGETMGMLGAPHCFPCWSPAIAFGDDGSENCIISLYVCPLPSSKREKKRYPDSPYGWEKITKYVEEKYG